MDANNPATPATPTTPPTPVSPTTSAPPGVPSTPGTALWIAQQLAEGKIDTTQAGRLARASGSSSVEVAKAAAALREIGDAKEPDTRSDDVKALDEQFPPGKPDEFLIRYAAPGQSEEMVKTKEVAAFDQSARAWLSGAEFPRELGNSLVNTIAKVTEHTKNMSASELESYGYAEFAKLEQAYGTTLDERLREAGRMVEALEAKAPGLKNLLKSNGIGDSALVVSLLLQQSERFWARRR